MCKGERNGVCNRTGCDTELVKGRQLYHIGVDHWYCRKCGNSINVHNGEILCITEEAYNQPNKEVY